MAEEAMKGAIQVEWVETTEEPFRPEKTLTIEAVLEPEEVQEKTFYSPTYIEEFTRYVPPTITKFPELPRYEAPPKELILNIETTGENPWERRLICIGVLDPNAPEPEPVTIVSDNEEEMLDMFLDFFEDSDYDTIVGYNVAFDYRFLYALFQRYRKTAPRFMEADLYDLMLQQKQVKQKYVFNYNKPGKLDEWIEFLLGIPPYAPQEKVLEWYKAKNYEKIKEFNAHKLLGAYALYTLDKIVKGEIAVASPSGSSQHEEGSSSSLSAESSEQGAAELIEVECPKCLQRNFMPKTAKVINCKVCGTPIANPLL